MGLFGKLLPNTTAASRGGDGGGRNDTHSNQDPWIPVAIEFAVNSHDDELMNDQQQQYQDFNDSFFTSNSAESAGAGIIPGGGAAGVSGAGARGIAVMTGRGINSREISPPQPGMMMMTTTTVTATPMRRVGMHDMVGAGINSRLSSTAAVAATRQPESQQRECHQQQQYQHQHQHYQHYHQAPQRMSTTNPFLDDDDNNNSNTYSVKRNPFHLEYDSSSSDASGKNNHSKIDTIKKHCDVSRPSAASPSGGGGGGGLQQFEDSVKLMEEKLNSIDNSKFMHFDHNTSTDDDNDDVGFGNSSLSDTASSGEEDSKRSVCGKDDAKIIPTTKKHKKIKSGGGATGLIKMLGKKKEKMRLRRQKQQQQQQQKVQQKVQQQAPLPLQPQRRQYHRPVVDSDDSSSEEDDMNSHISGEEEYQNSSRTIIPNSNNDVKSFIDSGGGGIGVPNGKGSQLTPSQLEDELYRYKLETLNLTDACRDLLEQLEEVEGRLGTVQAQATFRIHALEAELQDNTIGLKSLVKMTSTEMDGRLDALRAVSKTMAVQAARLKERDGELVQLEQRMRTAQREMQRLKRENKKILNEKKYLKMRLDELNQSKFLLEEDMKLLATENTARAAEFSAEEQSKIDETKKNLHDTMEKLDHVKSELECKDRDLIGLVASVEEKDGEIMKIRQELDSKERDIDRLGVQLEKVRKDLLDAATAARTAEEARVEAENREAIIRSDLETALTQMEEANSKVKILLSQELELKKQLNCPTLSEDTRAEREAQRAMLAEVQNEVEVLREEKKAALGALAEAHATHDGRVAFLEAEIDSLNKDVDVHREQMELAQKMLEEKETLASDLRNQLEEAIRDEALQVMELEEQLAARTRDLNKVTNELEERNSYIEILENKLEAARKEFIEHRLKIDTDAISEERSVDAGDDGTLQSSSTVPLTSVKSKRDRDHLVKLAEKDTQIDCLEREIRTNKLHIEQLLAELDEKQKHVDLLKTELERWKAKVDEIEAQLDEKNKSMESLRNQLKNEKEASNAMGKKMTKLQVDLSIAVESAEAAEDAHQHATSEMHAAKAARQEAILELDKLKSLVNELEIRSASAIAEVEIVKSDADKERKSSTQAAATLAATNAARQVQMEMTIEKLQKEIDSQRLEIEMVQCKLKERDETTDCLTRQLKEAKDDLESHKRGIEAVRKKFEADKEAEVLQRVADRDYFDEDDVISTKSNSSAEGGDNNRGKGLLGGLFLRSSNDIESENAVDWKAKAREKDARIAQLEKSLADNSLSLCNLRNELVTVTSKFKEDESQRRLLIQRLENENKAYSHKLEILEMEFGGSCMSMTDVTANTGNSQQTLTERENVKLRKQKRAYETRIESLQTQLSEIQQIVPELMSKSKLQIQKLENVIEHQRQETKANEQKLEQEVADLREQNEKLQAATRSRLQASDVERQHEIEELRLRLEAREATIKKLDAMVGGSIRKKDGKIIRKKKKKKAVDTNDNDGEISVLSVSTWGTEQQL